METKKITTEFFEYKSSDELPADEKQLIELARKASKYAYAPYSNFYVGAAVLLENGKIITANNQENAAYPSGMCAERVAVFSAVAQNPGIAVKAVAVSVSSAIADINNAVSPCGSCRQVLAEYEVYYNKDIKVIMAGTTGPVITSVSIKNLLPLLFSSKNLKKL